MCFLLASLYEFGWDLLGNALLHYARTGFNQNSRPEALETITSAFLGAKVDHESVIDDAICHFPVVINVISAGRPRQKLGFDGLRPLLKALDAFHLIEKLQRTESSHHARKIFCRFFLGLPAIGLEISYRLPYQYTACIPKGRHKYGALR